MLVSLTNRFPSPVRPSDSPFHPVFNSGMEILRMWVEFSTYDSKNCDKELNLLTKLKKKLSYRRETARQLTHLSRLAN